MFGVETFLLPDGSVLLNEVAPRPHNSGHYTIEACASSQYEAHLRAVLGWPAGDTGLRVGASLMLNILGEADGEEGERAAHQLMGRAFKVPGASVHWYGKAGVAPQRKIGHITIVGRDNEECRRRLRAIDESEWQRGLPRKTLRGLRCTQLALLRTRACATFRPLIDTFPLFFLPLLPPPPGAADAIEAATSKVASQLQQGAGGGSGGPSVGIIMGSDSDLPTMKAAAEVLEEFGVACEVTVVSAHRWVSEAVGWSGWT